MTLAQRSFAGGELAPGFYPRTDLAKYAVGLRTCRNFFIRRQGGALNRPGTEFVDTLTSAARLLPFVYNDAQSYLLVFTARELRVVRAGATLATIATPYGAAEVAALTITQSADVVTVAHPSFPPAEIRRTGDASWSLTPIVFAPTIRAPGGVLVNGTNVGGGFVSIVVTAISATGEESYASAVAGSPVAKTYTVTWTAVADATAYRIYERPAGGGGYGFVAEVAAPATTWIATGAATSVPDYFITPPAPRDLFAAVGDYPSAVGRYQQRLVFGGSNNAPETVWASRVGDTHNFTVSRPSQDDDAVTFTPAGNTVNLIRHILGVSPLLVLTSGGAFIVGGDGAGTLRPTDIAAQQLPVPGAGSLRPFTAEGRVLYVHARQGTVRAIVLGNYQGLDLTLYASHLFEGYTLVDWTYQETPHSIVWCVRSDGVLLGCTMHAGEDVLAWHRHDTDGTIENVCAIPEEGEDRIYLVVNRNGRRLLERMASRVVGDLRDAVFLDASLAYDGRNTTPETMTLSGGPRWASDELLTVTRSAGGFSPSEVGNVVAITDPTGLEVRVTLTGYTSATVMQGFPSVSVPASLQGAPRTTWSRAVDRLSGLTHLEGNAVGVLADGVVAANPLAVDRTPTIVTDGTITLDRPAAVIRVGLPYIADLETLDIDSPASRATLAAKTNVNAATVYVESSRGFWAGQALPTGADPLDGLDEALVRDETDGYGPIVPRTGPIDVGFSADWRPTGRFALRHIDPLPLTVSAIVPRGYSALAG